MWGSVHVKAGVGGCEPPCVCWQLNPGSLCALNHRTISPALKRKINPLTSLNISSINPDGGFSSLEYLEVNLASPVAPCSIRTRRTHGSLLHF